MHKDATRRGLFHSPLWFSGWGFPKMEVDCWRFALLRAAQSHEECRRVLGSSQLGSDIAVSDEPIQRQDVRQARLTLIVARHSSDAYLSIISTGL